MGVFYSSLPKADCGDYVVVTNARKVKVSGRKEDQVLYRKHTMYPGGLKEIKYKEMMRQKPDEVRKPHPMDKFWLPEFILSCIHSTDHSPGGVRNVAQKQTSGEEIREAPYLP